MLKTILTLGLMLLLYSVCFGQQTTSNQEKVVFKANTEFSIQLETAINTETNNVADDVKFILTEDVNGDGDKILKGSTIFARIANIEKLSVKNDTAKICIMFDFVKKVEDFVSLAATIVTLEPNPDAIKMTPSKMFSGGTTLSLKGKEIQLAQGKIFRVKLMQDITSK